MKKFWTGYINEKKHQIWRHRVANDYITAQLEQESAEAELYRVLGQWYRADLGDEHLLDVLLEIRPSLIYNIRARVDLANATEQAIEERKKRTLDKLVDDTIFK